MHLPSHFIDKEHEKQPIYFWNPDGTPQAFLSQWYPCHFAESDPASTPDPQEGGKKQKMIKYKTTEMYMMYRKALLFGDLETGRKILGNSHFARKVACDEHHKNEINRVMSGLTSHELSNVISPEATTPAEQRDLGRQVKDFNSKIWNENKVPIVEQGNYLKFTAPVPGQDETTNPAEKEKDLKELLLKTGERELVEASPEDRTWGIGFSAEEAPRVEREKWGLNLLGKLLVRVRGRIRDEVEGAGGVGGGVSL